MSNRARGDTLDDSTPASGDVEAAPAAATTIGRYLIEGELGAGGMGVVYRARDPELDRALAIKVVRPRLTGTEARARLLREAQAMAKLRHANVVPIFDVGLADAGVFVVMPLLEGGTLGAWLRTAGRPWRDVLERFVAAGRGLVAAHAAGLVHRDFKPDNVLLGDGGEVQVADFGLARIVAGDAAAASAPLFAERSLELTRTGALLGTPAYMAPEQLRSEPSDARGDQFSFCVALWQGLYGVRPFDAGEARGPAALTILLDAITEGRLTESPAATDVPAWLRAIVLRGLRADPAQRWPSMGALLAELDHGRARRGRRWPLALSAAVAVAAVVMLIVVASRDGEPARPELATPAPPPTYRLRQLTHRGNVWSAAISPDGTTIAADAGGSLIVRGIHDGDTERVLVEGIYRGTHSWSPDGRQLLFGTNHAGETSLAVVDLSTGRQTALGSRSLRAEYLSSTEIAALDSGRRAVELIALSDPSRPATTCPLAGELTNLKDLDVARGAGAVVVMAGTPDARNVLIAIDRTCHQLGTIALDVRIDAFTVTSDDALLVLTEEDGLARVTRYALDGRMLDSGRSLGVRADDLVGELGGRLYVLTGAIGTALQIDRQGDLEVLIESTTLADFVISPEGERVAWIEGTDARGGGDLSPGPLRITRLDQVGERGPALLTNARTVGWSPDGTSIAALVESEAGFVVIAVEVATGASSTLPLAGFHHGGAPIWLDGHRVGMLTPTRTGIGWVDLRTGERGTLPAPGPGQLVQIRSSPRDGRLAIQLRDGDVRSVWLVGADRSPHPTAVQLRSGESITWSAAGELVVVNHGLGTLEQAALDSGARKVVGRFSRTEFQNRIDLLPDGAVLTTTLRPVQDRAVLEPQ